MVEPLRDVGGVFRNTQEIQERLNVYTFRDWRNFEFRSPSFQYDTNFRINQRWFAVWPAKGSEVCARIGDQTAGEGAMRGQEGTAAMESIPREELDFRTSLSLCFPLCA